MSDGAVLRQMVTGGAYVAEMGCWEKEKQAVASATA